MGLGANQPIARIQGGDAGNRFSATVYCGSSATVFRDFSIRSRACSCRSVDVKRARTVPSVPFCS
ncbi:hypothetical protein D3C71_1928660 [compost metagenome]